MPMRDTLSPMRCLQISDTCHSVKVAVVGSGVEIDKPKTEPTSNGGGEVGEMMPEGGSSRGRSNQSMLYDCGD